MDDFAIRTDDLTDPQVLALLDYHLAEMVRVSPPDGVNALPIDGLKEPDVTFYTLWHGDELAGFGALKRVGLARNGWVSPFPGVPAAPLTHSLSQEAISR